MDITNLKKQAFATLKDKELKGTKLVIILLNGKPIKLNSRKSLFYSIDKAKHALRLHLEDKFRPRFYYNDCVYNRFHLQSGDNYYKVGNSKQMPLKKAQSVYKQLVAEVFKAVVFKEIEY